MRLGHRSLLASSLLISDVSSHNKNIRSPRFLLASAASGEIATSYITKQPAQFTTTLGASSSGSYDICRENSDNWLDGPYCWVENQFAFVPPLKTSVACNTVTYILNQQSKQDISAVTAKAKVTQLWTPTASDSSLWEYYTAWHQTVMSPMALQNSLGDCVRSPEEAPGSALPCEIYAQDIRLLYYPPKSPLSRDMCATTPLLTVTDYGSAKHVSQSVVEEMTLYKDRVYMSVDKIQAWTSVFSPVRVTENQTIWGCTRVPLGTTISKTLIELQSHEVSSIRIPHIESAYPFNFADLLDPIPRSAWLGRCIEGISSPYYFPVIGCADSPSTVYQPWLVMPTKVTRMDPKWASCAGYVLGWSDPPIALEPADSSSELEFTLTATVAQDGFRGPSKGTAVPGSMPSRTAIATSKPTPIKPFEIGEGSSGGGEFSSGQGTNFERQNGDNFEAGSESGGNLIPNDPKGIDPSGPTHDNSRPRLRLDASNHPSPTQDLSAYRSSLLKPGHSIFTLKDGKIVTIALGGLIVDTRSRGVLTIPYSALAPQLALLAPKNPPEISSCFPKFKKRLRLWFPVQILICLG